MKKKLAGAPRYIYKAYKRLKKAVKSPCHTDATPTCKTNLEVRDIRWGKFLTTFLGLTGGKTFVFTQVGSLRLYSVSGFSGSEENKKLMTLENIFEYLEDIRQSPTLSSLIDQYENSTWLEALCTADQHIDPSFLSNCLNTLKSLYPNEELSEVLANYLDMFKHYFFIDAVPYEVISPLLFAANSSLREAGLRPGFDMESFLSRWKDDIEMIFSKNVLNIVDEQAKGQFSKENLSHDNADQGKQSKMKTLSNIKTGITQFEKKIEEKFQVKLNKSNFSALFQCQTDVAIKKVTEDIKKSIINNLKEKLKKQHETLEHNDNRDHERIWKTVESHFKKIAEKCLQEKDLGWFFLQKKVASKLFRDSKTWDNIELHISKQLMKNSDEVEEIEILNLKEKINPLWAKPLMPHCAEEPVSVALMVIMKLLFQESGNATIKDDKQYKVPSMVAIDNQELRDHHKADSLNEHTREVYGGKPKCIYCEQNQINYSKILFAFEEANINVEAYLKKVGVDFTLKRLREALKSESIRQVTVQDERDVAEYCETAPNGCEFGHRLDPSELKVRATGNFEGLVNVSDGYYDIGPFGQMRYDDSTVYCGEFEDRKPYYEGHVFKDGQKLNVGIVEGENGEDILVLKDKDPVKVAIFDAWQYGGDY